MEHEKQYNLLRPFNKEQALEAIRDGIIKPPLMTEQAQQMMQWQGVASKAIASVKGGE